MKNLNTVDILAFILVIVGGINWGLVGLLDLDLVSALFGEMSAISRIVYSLVGAVAVYLAATSMQLGRK